MDMIALAEAGGRVEDVGAVRMCRCGDPEDYHRVNYAGGWYCVGKHRIHEAHPDTEACPCKAFEPLAEKQGRIL